MNTSHLVFFGVFVGVPLVVLGVSTYAAQPYWRVRYADGHVSRPMGWRQAHDYAEIFGGTVEIAPL